MEVKLRNFTIFLIFLISTTITRNGFKFIIIIINFHTMNSHPNNSWHNFDLHGIRFDHRKNYWSIHISRCIVVLSELLEDYTTAYACCWSFSCKNSIHLYTFFFICFSKVVLISCYQIVWMKKMCIHFHMFFKNSVGFVLSNCLNAKKIHLECELHNTV